jgi:hypothetical protein
MSTVRPARLFDGVHPQAGPYFAADHELVVDEAERRRLLAFLRSGAPLVQTTARDRDVVDPRRGRRVPMGYRTDGAWIWNEAAAYYLDAHGLAPDPALCEHIRGCGYACAEPDRDAVRRALSEFYAAS